MSKRLSAERLAEVRRLVRPDSTYAELLDHIEAIEAELAAPFWDGMNEAAEVSRRSPDWQKAGINLNPKNFDAEKVNAWLRTNDATDPDVDTEAGMPMPLKAEHAPLGEAHLKAYEDGVSVWIHATSASLVVKTIVDSHRRLLRMVDDLTFRLKNVGDAQAMAIDMMTAAETERDELRAKLSEAEALEAKLADESYEARSANLRVAELTEKLAEAKAEIARLKALVAAYNPYGGR